MDYTPEQQLELIINHLIVMQDSIDAIGVILGTVMYVAAVGAACVLFIVTLYAARNKSIWVLLIVFTIPSVASATWSSDGRTFGWEGYGAQYMYDCTTPSYAYYYDGYGWQYMPVDQFIDIMTVQGIGTQADRDKIENGECNISDPTDPPPGCASVDETLVNLPCTAYSETGETEGYYGIMYDGNGCPYLDCIPGSLPCWDIPEEEIGTACQQLADDGSYEEGVYEIAIDENGCEYLRCVVPDDCIDPETGNPTYDPDGDIVGTECFIEARDCDGEEVDVTGTWAVSMDEADCGVGEECGCLVCDYEDPEEDCKTCSEELEERFNDLIESFKDALGIEDAPTNFETVDMGIAMEIVAPGSLYNLDFRGRFNFNNLMEHGNTAATEFELELYSTIESWRVSIRGLLVAIVSFFTVLNVITQFTRMW